jgi:hypothetical protein
MLIGRRSGPLPRVVTPGKGIVLASLRTRRRIFRIAALRKPPRPQHHQAVRLPRVVIVRPSKERLLLFFDGVMVLAAGSVLPHRRDVGW